MSQYKDKRTKKLITFNKNEKKPWSKKIKIIIIESITIYEVSLDLKDINNGVGTYLYE